VCLCTCVSWRQRVSRPGPDTAARGQRGAVQLVMDHGYHAHSSSSSSRAFAPERNRHKLSSDRLRNHNYLVSTLQRPGPGDWEWVPTVSVRRRRWSSITKLFTIRSNCLGLWSWCHNQTEKQASQVNCVCVCHPAACC
jgi:hypothetical protein